MKRTIFLSLLVLLSLAPQHAFSGRNFCVWCNKATADSFMNCLGEKIMSNPRLGAISKDNVNDMKSSMLAASAAMTSTSPNAVTKMLNGALAGELAGMIRSQALNTGQSAESVTSELMKMIADCYISVTGESHVNFIRDLGKIVDFMMDDDQTDYYDSEVPSRSAAAQPDVGFAPEYPNNNRAPSQVSFSFSQQNNPPFSANNPSSITNNPLPQANNGPLQNNYQPTQNNYQPAQNNYQPAQNNYQPAQNNYQPAQNNYQPAQNNYQPVQGSNPFGQMYNQPQVNNFPQDNSQSFPLNNRGYNIPPSQANSPPFPGNNPVVSQINYSPSQVNKPLNFGGNSALPFQDNNPPPQGNDYFVPGVAYSSAQTNNPSPPQPNNPQSPQVSIELSSGNNNPQLYPGNQFIADGSSNSSPNQYPFNNNNNQNSPTGNNFFSNPPTFAQANVPENIGKNSQTNLNVGQINSQPMTSDSVKNYTTGGTGNNPAEDKTNQNGPPQPGIKINVQSNPMQGNANQYQNEQSQMRFIRPVPNYYYYDYPGEYGPQVNSKNDNEPSTAAGASVEKNPISSSPPDSAASNANNKQATDGNAAPNQNGNNLPSQSQGILEYQPQPISQGAQVNDQYPEYTYTFNSANSNDNWGTWKPNDDDTSSSAASQNNANKPFNTDNNSPFAIAVANANPESKPTSMNNDEANAKPSIFNVYSANSEPSATDVNTPKPSSPVSVQQETVDSEKSCAMRFAETLFVQVSQAPEFSQVLGTNTPKAFAMALVPEINKRAVSDSGFNDISGEVEALSKNNIGILPENSNSQAYAEKMTKSVMVPLSKIEKLETNCEDTARSIASNIIKYFKMVLPYLSSSRSPSNGQNSVNNAGDRSSSLSNVKQTTSDSPLYGDYYSDYSTSAAPSSSSSSDYYQSDYSYDYTYEDTYNYDQRSTVVSTSSTPYDNYEYLVSSQAPNLQNTASDYNEDEYCDDDIGANGAGGDEPTNFQNVPQSPNRGSQSYQDLNPYELPGRLPIQRQNQGQNIGSLPNPQANLMQRQGPWNLNQEQYPNYDSGFYPKSNQQQNPLPKQNQRPISVQPLNPIPNTYFTKGQNSAPNERQSPTSSQGLNPIAPSAIQNQGVNQNTNQGGNYGKPPLQSQSPVSESMSRKPSKPQSSQSQFPTQDQGTLPALSQTDQTPNSGILQYQGPYQGQNPSQKENPVINQDKEPGASPNQDQVKTPNKELQSNTTANNKQLSNSGQGSDLIPIQKQIPSSNKGEDFKPISPQNSQQLNQNIQNNKDISDSPLGKPNEEMKGQINQLMAACLNGITDTGYKYNSLTSAMASVSQDMKKTHADWGSDKILTLTYLETIVACTQVLQNTAVSKTLNSQSSTANSGNGGRANTASASSFVNVNPGNPTQTSNFANVNSGNMAQQPSSSNIEYPQAGTQTVNGAFGGNSQRQNNVPYQQGTANSGGYPINNSPIINSPVIANAGAASSGSSNSWSPNWSTGFYPNTNTGASSFGGYSSASSSSANAYGNSNGFYNANNNYGVNGYNGILQTGSVY